jgi:hypothetical protein
MKIKAAFKGLAGRLEDFFSKQEGNDLPSSDLLDQIDRSW